jgi:hypothetical protein
VLVDLGVAVVGGRRGVGPLGLVVVLAVVDERACLFTASSLTR